MDIVKLETGIKKQYTIWLVYFIQRNFYSDGVRSQDSDFWFSGNNIFGDNLKKYFEHWVLYAMCMVVF